MRLWSIHPKYLDRQGLIALWREGLLAKKVLEGDTKGYTRHPQLERFKNSKEPLKAINTYLKHVAEEAKSRGYTFDDSKITGELTDEKMPITTGQLEYEMMHLKNKLLERDIEKYRELSLVQTIEPHPSFLVKEGLVEDWEKR